VKGVSVTITTMALVLLSLALLAVVLPWLWGATVSLLDAIGNATFIQSNFVAADVYIIPPPVSNPYGTDQVTFVFNSGDITLTNVRVLLVDQALNVTELNLSLLRRDGTVVDSGSVVPEFRPGELIVAKVPAAPSYEGYHVLVQSREYTESLTVG